MGKKATEKKRNPNDATFRNVRALKARVERLEIRVAKLSVLWLDSLNTDPTPPDEAPIAPYPWDTSRGKPTARRSGHGKKSRKR